MIKKEVLSRLHVIDGELLDDGAAGALHDLAAENDLVKRGVGLVEVVDEVELADVAKVVVEDLDKEVDGLEARELVVVEVDAHDKEEPDVAPVHELVVAELDKVRVAVVARVQHAVDVHRQLLLLLLRVRHVPLAQPRLAHAVLHQHVVDHSLSLSFFFPRTHAKKSKSKQTKKKVSRSR